MSSGQWATAAVLPRSSSSSIFIFVAPSTRLSSPAAGPPPPTTSETLNSDVVVSALSPSFVCAAMLPFCFLIFGFALLMLVHRQQRHLQEILTLRLDNVFPPQAAATIPTAAVAKKGGKRKRSGKRAETRSAICGQQITTDSSSSNSSFRVLAEFDGRSRSIPRSFDNKNDLLSVSKVALIGSSTSSSVGYIGNERFSFDKLLPADAAPHFNTPAFSSSSFKSEYSRSFTTSVASTELPVTSPLSSVFVHRNFESSEERGCSSRAPGPPTARRNLFGNLGGRRIPGPPTAHRNLYDALGGRRNTIGGYGTALWSLVTSSLAVASRSAEGVAGVRMAEVGASADSLTGLGGQASISMEWDTYLPDHACHDHYANPIDLSETEHWV